MDNFCNRVFAFWFLTLMPSGWYCHSSVAQSFPFVIPGDDVAVTATDRSELLDKPAGKNGFVRQQGKHFFEGDSRIRFWGVNVCFASNFPSHEQADKVAPHLAKLGINAVRFHHMDMQSAPSGIWNATITDGRRTFDKEMVDRLDYFLAKLHEHGIYADLNLHVSRSLTEEEGFPVWNDPPWWAYSNKWVMYYDDDVQEKVKEYCREMLLHENPYRDGLPRVDDPGIALVEMLNENYFSVQGYELYRKLPQRFQDSFVAAWNRWLLARYQSQQGLIDAWESGQMKLGDDLFDPSSFTSSLDGWVVSLTDETLPRKVGVAGPTESGQSALRVAPKQILEQTHFQQIQRRGLSVEKDKPITLSFWVRADKSRSFRAELSTSQGGEWRDLGIFEDIEATPEWTLMTRVVLPKETISGDANLVMTIGNDTTPIEFSAIRLQQGVAPVSLPGDQNITEGTIPVPDASSPIAAHVDMKRFMVETETQWVAELKAYLKQLGVKVPITASQINYHPAELVQSQLDFVDLHNYWHHPMFPSGQSWSPENWTVGNDPMEAAPEVSGWPANSLLMRTGWRFADLPMTLSEWNYPEPSAYAGGCVPMAAIIAGLQDWDGIFFFDYDSVGQGDDDETWFRDSTVNFFSFNGAPVKLALVSQMANLFLRGDLKPLERETVSNLDQPIDGRYGISMRLGVRKGAEPSELPPMPDPRDLQSDDGQIAWQSDGSKNGFLVIDTPATRGIWGTIADQRFDAGGMTLSTGSIEPNYGFVFLSTCDGLPIESSKRSVLTVVSHSENQGMNWNEDKTSVGTGWGQGPTMVTSFSASLGIPRNADAPPLRCFALDGQGKRSSEVAVTQSGQLIHITVSPDQKTLWYELSVE